MGNMFLVFPKQNMDLLNWEYSKKNTKSQLFIACIIALQSITCT